MKLNPMYIKITAACVMLAASLAFASDFILDLLPDYYLFGNLDVSAWASVLAALGIGQLALLTCVSGCLKCRVWSDFLLQLSGLVLYAASAAFIVEYPPFTWAMGVFPILGTLFIFTGRILARQSRDKLLGD